MTRSEYHTKDAKLIEAINEAKGFRSRTRRNRGCLKSIKL